MTPTELLEFLERQREKIDCPGRAPALWLAQEAVLKKLPDIIYVLRALTAEEKSA